MRHFNFLVLLLLVLATILSVMFLKSPIYSAISGALAGFWIMKSATDHNE